LLQAELAAVRTTEDLRVLLNRGLEVLKDEHVSYGCHCDLESGQKPDGCVISSGRPQDCIYAEKLSKQGKGQWSCKYWMPFHSDKNEWSCEYEKPIQPGAGDQ